MKSVTITSQLTLFLCDSIYHLSGKYTLSLTEGCVVDTLLRKRGCVVESMLMGRGDTSFTICQGEGVCVVDTAKGEGRVELYGDSGLYAAYMPRHDACKNSTLNFC